ncbi:calpain-2 catalytic subunit-like [Aulostomus maculatus]
MTSSAAELARQKAKEGEGARGPANALPFNRQDFQSLRGECLKNRSLFCDPTFPASWDSLGYKELGPHSPKTIGVEWKRPGELCSDPRFIADGATRTDICQGELGDCWLLAAIASLTLDPQILSRVVPSGQSFSSQYAGIFHFQLWQYGEWVDVVVDDRLPVKNGRLIFVHSAEGGEFWSALLEKAYAKVNGSYEALNGGTSIEGFEDFTGGISESYELKDAPPFLFNIMRKALKLGSLLGCSIYKFNPNMTKPTSQMLVRGHAYSITAAEKVHHCGSVVELLRIRNPWGEVEWCGAWSDQSKEWDGVQPEERKKLDHVAEDGEFWMSYSDFLRQFSRVDICNLTPNALTSKEVGTWKYAGFDGMWRVGSTAGGCRKFGATFCSNPQFFIRMDNVDDDPHDGEDGCTVLIGLMQKDVRREQRSGQVLDPIGFDIYQVPDEYKGRRDVHLGPDVLLRVAPVAGTNEFIQVREVCKRFKLPPGEYVIIPSTFEPHCKGSFFLRVFTEKHAMTSPMEEDVQANISEADVAQKDVDPRFKRFFLQIAGKMDSSATLGLVEFHTLWMKIQKYLEIFMRQDADGSGTISSHEMRAALAEAGFKVNSNLLQEIVDRYANQYYAIDFDSFVGCLIRLEMLFRMFHTLDTKNQGKIQLDLQQWLCLAIN